LWSVSNTHCHDVTIRSPAHLRKAYSPDCLEVWNSRKFRKFGVKFIADSSPPVRLGDNVETKGRRKACSHKTF